MATDRRGFRRRAAAALGGLFGVLFGGPAAVTAVAPAFRSGGAAWRQAGAADAVVPGAAVRILLPVAAGWEQRARPVFLVRDGDAVVALSARCTHSGCTVRFDAPEARFLCPCHGGVFSLTGAPLEGPPKTPLERLATRIVDGRVEVRA